MRRGGGNPRHQTYDSTGPDVKVRGSASQIFEKYLLLARDANSMGDRVTAENYLQHAEHYYRILNVREAGSRPRDGDGGEHAAEPAPPSSGNGAAGPAGESS